MVLVETIRQILLFMAQVRQQEYPELNSYINNFIKPNDTKAWIAILISLGYELLAVALIHLNLSMLGWMVHTLNIVRLFIQFHDMAHFSYFTSLRMNKLIGHVIGVYVHFPFDMWRDGHNFHHKHFGNLDRVDLSQTILFTKKQYESWPLFKRILVRVFREPVVFFFVTIQVLWLFGILANCIKRYGMLSASVVEKILGVIVYVWVFDWLGLPALNMVISLYAAQAIGTILFHLQHSVNVPYREHKQTWNFTTAALEGSTFLQIPFWLRPFTNGIEYHHIHHLNTNVASYVISSCHNNLQKEGSKKWQSYNINQVGTWLSFKSLFNVMLDEQKHQLVPFSYKGL